MRTIHKGPEPPVLVQYRAVPGTTFAHLNEPAKNALREALVHEQRGLCCFCMGRIRPHPDAMKVAHWHSQARHPTEQLDYANLLGACLGNQGLPPSLQHCDTRQGDRDLSRNPADPADCVEDRIRYAADGTILSDDQPFDQELNKILNLNVEFLRNNRKAVLQAFKEYLDRVTPGDWTEPVLVRHLRRWNGESNPGDLPPFCQVVVYWLRKRLGRI